MTRNLAPLLLALAASCAAPSDKPEMSTTRIGHCAYVGQFSRMDECKDYLGAWTNDAAVKDCTDLKGTYEGGSICTPSAFLGACLFAKDPAQVRQYIVSANTEKCGSARTGCETFGGGYWDPAPVCGGGNDELVVTTNAWKEPQRICFTPAEGEAPGKSENGQVCVWEAIHGATEEGRSFRDDAKCDNSRSGRPYYAKAANPLADQPDARRDNAEYLAEEAWVKSQINSASCVCCHSTAAPDGKASIFDTDREGSFANQLTDRGVAQGAGVVWSIPLGAFPAEKNNGFAKSDWEHPEYSVFLSTDPARMKAFWQRELDHRGLTAADFVGKPDGFGPLSEQLNYVPTACEGTEGIAADGTITWGNGRARYVYVLATDSKSPTVYPNLDTPAGTIWRLDVPHDGTPLVSGTVKYGVVPAGLKQSFPATGAPAALVKGQSYYLYVSADQMLPITRCLVTAK